MSVEFGLPQMGFDMTEASIARWNKKEGDVVAPGEVLAEIATEKVNLELVDHPGGLIEKILVPEGQTVPVGTPIVRFADEKSQLNTQSSPVEGDKNPANETVSGAREATDLPVANGVDPIASEGDDRVIASPLAKKLAVEHGVALSQIVGTGPGGRILRDDVVAAVEAHGGHIAPPPSSAPRIADQPVPLNRVSVMPPDLEGSIDISVAVTRPAVGLRSEMIELSPMRQAIARRLQESKQQIPHFYLSADVRMDRLAAIRSELNEAVGGDVRISVNDFIVKATAVALGRFPRFNAWFVDGKIRTHNRVHIGIAVALEDGLVVPALLDCQNRSLTEISVGAKEMIQRAKKGLLKSEEFTGGTFSISNLGMMGVDYFYAIINPPQVGVMSVGSVRKVPLVENDQVVVGSVMKLGISVDHRAIDGSLGAKFLMEVKRLLENPALMLL